MTVALIVATLLQVTATPAGAVVDPALITGLEGVVALSPPDTCLRVDLGRANVYRHQADRPLVPASTQKLLVAHVALDTLGAQHRSRTLLRGPEPVEGVVFGDLTLVGGGDPLLTTATYAFVQRTADQPLTFLDALADQVVAAGITHVTGAVFGDESRYDSLRTVATWPARYLTQNQIGPLGALSVNDGFSLELAPPGETTPPKRSRAVDPALDAASIFTALLRDRGVIVQGEPTNGIGSTLEGAPTVSDLAFIESAPLSDVVRQLLEQSDNGTAELLTKELGLVGAGAGTTQAGTSFIEQRAQELGLPAGGVQMMDGSGLDPANTTTCDELVSVLAASGGPAGTLGAALPIAGRTGTLRGRFRGTPAEGRLRAKTGSLNGVTSLAGFVEMPDGQIATFAYIANGPQAEDPRRGQDFLGALLAQYEQLCLAAPVEPLVVPVGAYLVRAAPLAGPVVPAALGPALTVALEVFEEQPHAVVGSCLADDPDFSLRLPA